jgi:hypothetical protein
MPPPSIFPSEPAANDTFVLDDRTYIWTGAVWQLYAEPSGVQLVDSVAGKTGAVTLNQDDVADVATPPRYQTWTQVSMPAETVWNGLAFGNRVFVAINSFGSAAATSPDGVNWTARTLPASTNWNFLDFANGTFFAFRGSGANTFATSTDGVTWTLRSISAPRTTYKNLVYGNGTFVLNCSNFSNHNTLLTSADGVTWTQITLPATVLWQNLAFGAGRFLIDGYSVSTGAPSFATSTDGTTWTQATLPLTVSIYGSVIEGGLIYADGYFFMFPYYSVYPAAKSRDGVTWTYFNATVVNNTSPSFLKFGNGTFLGFVPTGSGEIPTASSQDGQNWLRSDVGLGMTYPSNGSFLLAYGRGRFVVIFGASAKTCFAPLLNAGYGTAADSMCAGDDQRLSDARPKLSTASSLDHGNSGTSKTLSATAALQTCSLTGNCTFTLPSAASFYDFTLILKQTGSFTATFTGVRWPGGSAPTISTGADKVDIVRFVSNGSNWYGMITQNT